MKILILGSSGFVGKNMTEFFQERYEVYTPMHSELDVLEESTVKKQLMSQHYDIVINAVDLKGGDSNYFENRLRMFWNLFKYREYYGKMIYYGSGAEYGRDVPLCKVKESDLEMRNIPMDTYGFCLQQMNYMACKSENIYNLRLFGIFGKYELWQQRFISNMICRALYDLPFIIKQNRIMDFLSINDLCYITEWCMTNNMKFHDYNAVSGNSYELCHLANLVKEITGSKSDIIIAKDGYFMEYTGSNERLCGEIKIKFENMIKSIEDLVTWYQQNKSDIDREKLLINNC